MDYETYIDIKQYSTDCYFSYTLKEEYQNIKTQNKINNYQKPEIK